MDELVPGQVPITKVLQTVRESARDAVMVARTGSTFSGEDIEVVFRKLDSDLRAKLSPLIQEALRATTLNADPPVRQLVARALRSGELLRFQLIPNMTETNPSPETLFEKHLASEEPSSGDTQKWANAIPIWSGVRGPRTDTKANIDVGYTDGAGRFVLCELKIASNEPLYAIAELATYIVGYLVVRKLVNFVTKEISERICQRGHGLLHARSIDWCVVAPHFFYEQGASQPLSPAELDQLRACAETHFRSAVHALGIDELNLTVSLRSFACDRPPPVAAEARNRWIRDLKERTPLRKLLTAATPVR